MLIGRGDKTQTKKKHQWRSRKVELDRQTKMGRREEEKEYSGQHTV
jgi:hypothetical protein